MIERHCMFRHAVFFMPFGQAGSFLSGKTERSRSCTKKAGREVSGEIRAVSRERNFRYLLKLSAKIEKNRKGGTKR